LTARGGCYGDNQAHTYTCLSIARNSHPRANITSLFYLLVDSLSQAATTKSMTPTFQVDDLRCIADARATADLT